MKDPFPPTAGLRALYSDIDTEIQPNLDSKFKVSCTKGCHHCCSLLALTVRLEAINMAEPFLSDARLRLTLPSLLDSLVKNALDGDFEGLTHETYFNKNLKCPFLSEGLCSIYERRPSSCRYHNVISDPSTCDPNHPIGEVMRIDLLFAEDLVSEYCFSVTQNPNPAPISIMMLWAFDFISKMPINVFGIPEDLISKIQAARAQVPSPEEWLKKHIDTLTKERMFKKADGTEA